MSIDHRFYRRQMMRAGRTSIRCRRIAVLLAVFIVFIVFAGCVVEERELAVLRRVVFFETHADAQQPHRLVAARETFFQQRKQRRHMRRVAGARPGGSAPPRGPRPLPSGRRKSPAPLGD
jgi:hypothetical protein